MESASSAAPAAPRPERDVAASDEVVALRELLIGRKIEVYWGRDKRWYPGTVSGFEDGLHSIDCAIIATQFRPWFYDTFIQILQFPPVLWSVYDTFIQILQIAPVFGSFPSLCF